MNGKPGVRTSEFWVTVILSGATFLKDFFGFEVDATAAAAVYAPAIAYIIARGLAKWKKA